MFFILITAGNNVPKIFFWEDIISVLWNKSESAQVKFSRVVSLGLIGPGKVNN